MDATSPTVLLFHIILLFFILPFASPAQSSPNITLGSSLSPQPNSNSIWALSPSGDFAFGFLPLEPGLFLLAIWFAKLPSNTVVWSANTVDNAAVVQEGSRVELMSSGRLSLLNNTGQEVWFADPGSNIVTNGAMLDTGNLVLAGDSTTYAWQSFDNPTDTILPTQMIRQGGKLSSRRSSRINDYSNGRFQLRLLPDGNLVLNTIGFPTEVAYERYWISNNTYQITDDRVFFNPNYGVNVVQNNTNLYNVTTTNFGSVANLYQRATLDFDGVFRQYKYNKLGTNTNGSSQNSWLAMDFVPRDICTDLTMSNGGSGACGFNSYCSINGDKPSCLCPDHYTPLDPDDIINQGCRPDFEAPSCELYDPADFEMVEKYNVDWPNEDYEQLAPMEEDGCKKACLEDCRCSVAVFGSGNCWKKKMPMSNGRIDPNNGRIIIFKISKVALNGSYNFTIGNKKDNKTTVVISLSAILGGSMLINFISIASVILLLLWKRRRVAEMKIKSKTIKSNLHAFSYMALEKATNKFNEELGKGSFGSVYKGVLISLGEVPVAVKKLNGMEHHGEKEFITELTIIGRTHHRNLVQLIGFCDEGSHRLLVYEFMSNGTLASYLFQTEKPRWEKRVQIAYGVARVLEIKLNLAHYYLGFLNEAHNLEKSIKEDSRNLLKSNMHLMS